MSLRRPGSLRWFVPGLHIKRWLLLLGISVAIIALGGAYALRSLYENGARLPRLFRYVTLAFLPGPVRALLFAVLVISLLMLSLYQLSQSMLVPFLNGDEHRAHVH